MNSLPPWFRPSTAHAAEDARGRPADILCGVADVANMKARDTHLTWSERLEYLILAKVARAELERRKGS